MSNEEAKAKAAEEAKAAKATAAKEEAAKAEQLKNAKFLSPEAILAKDDNKTDTVYIAEWDGKVTVRTLTAAESEHVENFLLTKRTDKGSMRNVTGFRETVISKCVVKPDGVTPLFSPKQVKDLMKKNSNAVDAMFEAAVALNGLSLGSQKELEKN